MTAPEKVAVVPVRAPVETAPEKVAEVPVKPPEAVKFVTVVVAKLVYPPTPKSPVLEAEARVALPLVERVPRMVVLPACKVEPRMVAPVTSRVEEARRAPEKVPVVAERAARVEAPLTPRVPPFVALLVAWKVATFRLPVA